MPRARLSAIVLAAAIALPTCVALAQQAPSGGPRPVTPKASKEAPPTSDAGLLKRVEQLEEQLVDMQVLVGTLESLAKGGPRPPPTSVYKDSATTMSAADAGRLDALETQVRALAAQLESLQDQLRSLADRPPGPGAGGFGAVTVAPGEPKDGASKEEEPKDDLDRVFPPSKAKTGKTAKTAPPPGESLIDEDTPPQQLSSSRVTVAASPPNAR